MSDGMRTHVTSFAQDYPAVMYFALTLALSWTIWTLSVVAQAGIGIYVGSFGPALAAVIATRLRGYSVRGWLRTVIDPRTNLKWYGAAVVVPLIWVGALLAGAAVWTGSVDTASLVQFAPQVPFGLLFVMLVGGGNEEFGWRGFALPALQERTDALTASVLIGVIWAVWHLPLFVFGVAGYSSLEIVPAYTVYAVGASVVLTWLYNESGPSILPVMILHGMNNTVIGPAMRAGGIAGGMSGTLVRSAPIWATALLALVVYGRTQIANSLPDTTIGANTAEPAERA